ncbi:MAG: hypothetical protein ACK5P5_07175 [Pseudobdellovibrionaceae bacterium]
MSASWIFNLKKLLQAKPENSKSATNSNPIQVQSFLQKFRSKHKNSGHFSKDELAQFFFQIQKAKCDQNVIFLKRHLMPDIYKKMNAFVQECKVDSLKLELKGVKFKNFQIHSPRAPSTGAHCIHLLLEYSVQECWSDLRSKFQKEQFRDLAEVWELLYSEKENKFYLFWIYDLSGVTSPEIEHLADSLKAA